PPAAESAAPLAYTVMELPDSTVLIVVNSQPPSVFCTKAFEPFRAGRVKMAFVTKIWGRLIAEFPLSRAILFKSEKLSTLPPPEELSSPVPEMECDHVYEAWIRAQPLNRVRNS